ncbi:MAG: 3-hydroxyacyl-CoA dehydrogenase NAD-binding domain-containing protein, partial [Roseovarius sp.]
MAKGIIIVGAGTMGQSIGRLFAQHGWTVQAVDPTEAAREAFLAAVPGATASAALEEAGQADLALECVPEDLALKRRVLAALEVAVPEGAP